MSDEILGVGSLVAQSVQVQSAILRADQDRRAEGLRDPQDREDRQQIREQASPARTLQAIFNVAELEAAAAAARNQGDDPPPRGSVLDILA